MKHDTLETQIFDWDGWDGDHDCMIFYKVKLKVPVGKFPVGTKFDTATILFDKSILQLCNHEPVNEKFGKTRIEGEYRLKLSVGEPISENMRYDGE